MTDRPNPHRLNVVGPFYVEDGCCTACGVPESIAPQLFAHDEEAACYVAKQPESPRELDQMIDVLATQELHCVRYRGADPIVRRRISDREEGRTPWPLFSRIARVLRRLRHR